MSELWTTLSDVGGWQLTGLAIAIFGGAFLRAFTGFGFAIAALPVLALVLDPRSATFIVALLGVVTSLRTWRLYMTKPVLHATLPLLPGALVGTVAGALLLGIMSPVRFQLAAGIMVIVASIMLQFYKPGRIRHPGLARHGSGLTSGLMNGALAVPGPPVIIYAIAAFERAEQSRAFLMLFFVFSGCFAIASYVFAGYVEGQQLLLAIIAWPFLYAGDKIGFLAFDQFGTKLYRSVAITALLVVGIATTTRAAFLL